MKNLTPNTPPKVTSENSERSASSCDFPPNNNGTEHPAGCPCCGIPQSAGLSAFQLKLQKMIQRTTPKASNGN
ncbi:MAG: hypothetical protein SFY68_07400 [Candidatus Sumerlaeia bacterium]|nr:hypothetical protein [Candidatus Sumerlaeia bacterium]